MLGLLTTIALITLAIMLIIFIGWSKLLICIVIVAALLLLAIAYCEAEELFDDVDEEEENVIHYRFKKYNS